VNWGAVAAVTAVVCAVASLVSSWSALAVKASMEKMRADLAEARAKDREELREWINGSFLRSSVAVAEMKAFDIRLNRVERDNDNRQAFTH
jgi:hypothetical protein